MKILTLFTLIISTTMAQQPQFQHVNKAFKLSNSVSITINASPEAIWKILTDGSKYTDWNSTIISLDGSIKTKEKIKLKVKVAPKRVFKIKVKEMHPHSQMVWASGAAPMFRGVRTFTLKANGDGTTTFTMTEVMRGIMLPMAKGSLPDFQQPFKDFAADLKKAAEQE